MYKRENKIVTSFTKSTLIIFRILVFLGFIAIFILGLQLIIKGDLLSVILGMIITLISILQLGGLIYDIR